MCKNVFLNDDREGTVLTKYVTNIRVIAGNVMAYIYRYANQGVLNHVLAKRIQNLSIEFVKKNSCLRMQFFASGFFV